ncbi:MAG TPA: chromate efflux transporter [Bacteroidia bacterium]|nr:chromate efflux transporter [Bacteroidia bacterium]
MEKPAFKEALKFWTKLGFISFGGPAGQIAIMHEFLVDRKKWISNSRFFHALNYCMILPGPEAQQLAIYIGWLLHGKKGGFAAGILFFLPSMFILLALSIIYVLYGNLPWVNALFDGVKPAVIAIVLLALLKIAKRSLKSYFHYFVAACAFISIFFFNIPFPLIIVSAVVLAAIIRKFLPGIFHNKNASSDLRIEREEDYYLNQNSLSPLSDFKFSNLLKQVFVTFVLWALPLFIFFKFANDFKFWNDLSLFFTKAALVTFGGAYAVLPYVAQVSVEQLNWLDELQMIDGLALGETTPGPLIMVLSFVGFMAGYNHFNGSLLMGTFAMATTVFYTFLPCFLFIFAGAPIMEKTQENKKVKEILEIVIAAIVGVILNLTIFLGKAVLFPKGISFDSIHYISLGWLIISVVALYHYKINMVKWIALSAIFGLCSYLISTLT